jgi:hypothetical protein
MFSNISKESNTNAGNHGFLPGSDDG